MARPPSRVPLLQGVLPLDLSRLPVEAVAGTTLAALAIPEVMGYAKIAGMPVITGLYTMLLPLVAFAVAGSSRHLVVGADSATAAILAAALAGMAAAGSPQYVALAGVAAILTGAMLIGARLARLSLLADFLSRSVLIGFLTGVGIQVAMGQLPGMLGIPAGHLSGPAGGLARQLSLSQNIEKFAYAISRLPHTSVPTVVVSAAVIVVILGARRFSKRIPAALIAVAGAIAVSYYAGLAAHGVAPVGAVPSGLPHAGLPAGGWAQAPALMAASFSMFIVILAQSAATSRAYGARYGERVSEEEDLVGLGVANLSAGLTGAFVVNGSPTKSQMVDSAGGRSQLSMLIAAAVVVAVLLFLTGPLAYMPEAVLSAVVFLIGVELINVRGMRQVLAARPVEFWVALATTVTVVLVGVEQAILLAVALSLVAHVRHGYKPQNLVLGPGPGDRIVPRPVSAAAQAVPGLIIYVFTHSAYYANASLMYEEVNDLARRADPPLRWFCFDGRAVDDIDYTSGLTLLQIHADLAQRGIRLVLASVGGGPRSELERDGLARLVGREGWFEDAEAVIESYRAAVAAQPPSGSRGAR